jgi:hypothetical protein
MDNDVRLFLNAPDNALMPLIAGVPTDDYYLAVVATREDEAVGTTTARIGNLEPEQGTAPNPNKETRPSLRLFALGASPCCLARRARPAAAQAIV